jgi:hypothetical protein
VTALRYARADNIVWRAGPDRVLVRRVGHGAVGARDLLGAAAIVWLALDNPLTMAEMMAHIDVAADHPEQLQEALATLEASGLVTAR